MHTDGGGISEKNRGQTKSGNDRDSGEAHDQGDESIQGEASGKSQEQVN